MAFRFVEEEKACFGMSRLCRVLGVCARATRVAVPAAVISSDQRRCAVCVGQSAAAANGWPSDRASQFRSRECVLALSQAGLLGRRAGSRRVLTTPPWSRSSACARRMCLNRKRWDTREELRLAIVTWIERTYHCRRRQEGLGRLTPVEFEMIHHSTSQTATPA